jgi:nitroreductase
MKGESEMSFLELAKKRYSARSYQTKQIEPEKLDAILEAGRLAPTAHNNQPQRVLVVQSPEGLAKVRKGYSRDFGAACVLIVCADHSESWRRSYDDKDSADIDASIVTTHMMLCAKDLGIDSVWVCAFDPTAIREEFSIPETYEPINILMLGYAACEPKSPDRHGESRKPLDQTVFFERF